MVIDRGLIDLRLGDDGADAGALVTVARKRTRGGLDDLLPRHLGDAGQFCRPRHQTLQFKRAFETNARSWPRQGRLRTRVMARLVQAIHAFERAPQHTWMPPTNAGLTGQPHLFASKKARKTPAPPTPSPRSGRGGSPAPLC